jgi:ABC-type transport system involved in multi-copper enzyme maturation permease subunit
MPIARREMLVLAKAPRTYRYRIVSSAVLVVIGGGFAFFYERLGVAATFPLVGGIGMALSNICVFLGAQLTSDSIAREKREGTLGLLFLTGLGPFQIVAGKLVAHGLAGFYAVFIGFPLVSLIMIAGGVLFRDILLVAVALLNTLFVTACIGIYASCCRTDRKRASSQAVWTVLAFWWGVPVAAQLCARLKAPGWISEALRLFALNGTFYSKMFFGLPAGYQSPWWNFLCTNLLGWMFLGLAAWQLPRRWQDAPAGVQTGFNLKEWWRRISYGNDAVRAALRARLLERNPFLWLASRDRLRFLGASIATFGMVAVALAIFWVSSSATGTLLVFVITLGVVHKVMLCSAGATQLIAEQEQGALEMLISTPLTADQIIRGQFRATARYFWPPVALALLLQLFTLFILFRAPWDPAFANMRAGPLAYVLLYLFDLYTAIWLAMWGAVLSREPKHAVGAALGRLLFLPGLIFFAGAVALWTASAFLGAVIHVSRDALVPIWFGLGIINNFFWLRRIRARLPGMVRTYAFRRYLPEETGLFGSLGRWSGSVHGRMRGGSSVARIRPQQT